MAGQGSARVQADGVGRVFVFRLSPTNGSVVNSTEIGNGKGGLPAGAIPGADAFGTGIAAGVGDLSGDGLHDIVVGAPQLSLGGCTDCGSLFVLFMSPTDRVLSFKLLRRAPQGDAFPSGMPPLLGSSITALPPRLQAADNAVDLVLGFPGIDRVLLIRMASNGSTFSDSVERIGNGVGGVTPGTIATSSQFGAQVAAAGDQDGNGIEDLLVSAPMDDEGGIDSGAVYIVFLNPSLAGSSLVDRLVKLTRAHPRLAAVIPAGGMLRGIASFRDLSGSHASRIVVGIPSDSTGGVDRGSVVVLDMGGAAAQPSLTPSPTPTPTPSASPSQMQGAQASGIVRNATLISGGSPGMQDIALQQYDLFGRDVSAVGDLDMDGVPDLAVFAMSRTVLVSNDGALFIVLLHRNGTAKDVWTLSADVSLTSYANGQFGSCAARFD